MSGQTDYKDSSRLPRGRVDNRVSLCFSWCASTVLNSSSWGKYLGIEEGWQVWPVAAIRRIFLSPAGLPESLGLSESPLSHSQLFFEAIAWIWLPQRSLTDCSFQSLGLHRTFFCFFQLERLGWSWLGFAWASLPQPTSTGGCKWSLN